MVEVIKIFCIMSKNIHRINENIITNYLIRRRFGTISNLMKDDNQYMLTQKFWISLTQ